MLFGDPEALASAAEAAADSKAAEEARRNALQTLVDRRPEGLLSLLRDLVADPALAARRCGPWPATAIPERPP